MTTDIKALALRLAKDVGLGSNEERNAAFPKGYAVYCDRLERLVRAALAEGLRMGAEVCADEDVAPNDDATGVQECIAAALRAKADEMER